MNKKKSILVVDDNPVLLSQMTRLLEDEGHQVATSKDGFSALNMLASLTPDLAFIDLIMPNIGGDNLCRLIRKMPHLKDCFIVVVSAAVVEQEFDYQKIGADACIAKGPFDLMRPHIMAVIQESDSGRPDNGEKAIRGIEKITVRRITQELLSKSHHLETVLESIPEGVMEILEGRVVYANSMATTTVEMDAETMLGSKFLELFPRRLHPRIAPLLNTKPGEVTEIGQDQPLSLNNREIILKCLALVEGGTKLMILTDVTNYKTVERALKEAMEYNENILNTMAESLVVIKPDLSINFTNRSTCEMLGYSPHDLYGMHIDNLFFDAISFEKEMYERVIQTGLVTEPNMAFESRSGERIPVSFLASTMYETITEGRNLLGIICIAHNIREVEQLQQQLYQAEKIASFGVLAAGVAHEIKNPLAVMLQGLETLQTGLAGSLSPTTMTDVIERIRNAALRANKIVEGLLNFSRQKTPEFIETDLISVLHDSLSFIEHHFRTMGIEIKEHLATGSHRLRIDANQIQQVFINIMVNAAEAMTKGGTLTIETELDDDGKWMRVKFSDTGGGIAEDDLQRVTDPFFQLKQSL